MFVLFFFLCCSSATVIYTLSLHDALPISVAVLPEAEEVDVDINQNELKIDVYRSSGPGGQSVNTTDSAVRITRSEEHTSELQSRGHLVCRLLLEKKK